MTAIIHNYRDYLQHRYGTVLHRVPIDAGFSCPHRKRDGSGGCTFCPGDGARAVQLGTSTVLSEQIEKGVRFAKRRYGATDFMAYLQAFTTTFRSKDELYALVGEIAARENFRAIAFGTRPDALPPQAVRWLSELQQESPFDIWVELGIQSSHDRTLKKINRGHNWQQSREALLRLAAAEISTVAHLVIGLKSPPLPILLSVCRKKKEMTFLLPSNGFAPCLLPQSNFITCISSEIPSSPASGSNSHFH